VRWALDHKGWPHTRESLLPGFHIPRVRRLTGQNRVPVLILDGVAIRDSARILERIESRCPEPPLFPTDPVLRERATRIESYFDDEVAPALRRLFWACYLDRPEYCVPMATMGASRAARAVWRGAFPVMRPLFRRNMLIDERNLARAREQLGTYVSRLESEISASGYLVGESFGVADLAVASVMTAILRPPEFPYPLPEPWPPQLIELRASIIERAGCQWVMNVYRRHRGRSAEIVPGAA